MYHGIPNTECLVSKKSYRQTVRGGAPPHTDTLIRTAACGRVQIGQFKNKAPVLCSLSGFSPSSRSNSRTDDPEAGPLDSRLNIGWDKLSRRIQDFVKAVTSQNQQRNDAFHLNAEPATYSLHAPTRLPGDVMQQQRAAEISKEPRAHKQSLKVFQATQRTTWDWKSFGKPLHERK